MATFESAMTFAMHDDAPLIEAAEKNRRRRGYDHRATITAVHVTDTARQGAQKHEAQHNFDLVNRKDHLLHKPNNSPETPLGAIRCSPLLEALQNAEDRVEQSSSMPLRFVQPVTRRCGVGVIVVLNGRLRERLAERGHALLPLLLADQREPFDVGEVF